MNDTTVSKGMVKYVGSLPSESIVDVEGVVTKPEAAVDGCTQKEIEIDVCFATLTRLSLSQGPITTRDRRGSRPRRRSRTAARRVRWARLDAHACGERDDRVRVRLTSSNECGSLSSVRRVWLLMVSSFIMASCSHWSADS